MKTNSLMKKIVTKTWNANTTRSTSQKKEVRRLSVEDKIVRFKESGREDADNFRGRKTRNG